jgi:hypothetical protein
MGNHDPQGARAHTGRRPSRSAFRSVRSRANLCRAFASYVAGGPLVRAPDPACRRACGTGLD